MLDVSQYSYDELRAMRRAITDRMRQFGKLRGRPRSPFTEKLARCPVGESFEWHGKLHHDSRKAARKLLADPNAQWSSYTLPSGKTLVTRIR